MPDSDLPPVYLLESVEQMRAIADQLRQRIIRELIAAPRTVTQVADALGLAPARVHYHVRELERVGLVRLVFTREKGGILEKYFQPVAQSLRVEDDLLQQAAPAEYIELTQQLLSDVRRSFLNALARDAERPHGLDFLSLRLSSLWVTPAEFNEVLQEFEAALRRFKERRGLEDEREVSLVVLTNEPGPASLLEERNAGETRAPRSAFPAEPTSRTRKTWMAGAASWSAAELEATVARGETLDITVLGVCTFAPDVSPELADRAVSRCTVHGKLSASPEVRAVLTAKGGRSGSSSSWSE